MTPPYGTKWRRIKEPLDENEKESEKVGLKLNIQKTKIMASSPITSWEIDGVNSGNSGWLYFSGLQTHCRWWLQPWNEKTPWKESYDQPREHMKKQRHYFVNKGPSCQGYGFSSSHVWMGELDYKESSAPKNWFFWTVVLEKTLKSPLDCKEMQPVHPKGNQSWIFIGRTDVEVETPILWPPDVKSRLVWIDPDAGKDWRQEEKGTTKDGMVGWHHGLNGRESKQTPGVGDRQGGLACYSPCGHRVRHEWVTELNCGIWFSKNTCIMNTQI